ncbi:MAG: hypothetical protein ACSLFA_05840 [Mycobacterium sp.]
MLTEQQIAAQADFLRAKLFFAQFRAEREHLAGQLSRQAETLSAATARRSDEQARAARGAIRFIESNIRQIDRVLGVSSGDFPMRLLDEFGQRGLCVAFHE